MAAPRRVRDEMTGLGVVVVVVVVAMAAMTSSATTELCSAPPEDVLFTTGQACLITETLRFPDMFMLSSWEKLCSATNATESCLRKQFRSCSPRYIRDILSEAMAHQYSYVNTWIPSTDSMIQMITRGCHEFGVQEGITYAYQQAKNFDCMNDKTRSDVTKCVNVFLDETAVFRLSDNTSSLTSPDRRQSLIRFGLSTFQCVRNLIRANCSLSAQDLLLELVNETVPQPIRLTFVKDKVDVPLNKMSILSTQRSTVGAFGGVHLVIYGLIKPMTCLLSGHVIYLSNQLFTISGYNQGTDKTRRTYIKKLEIEFFRTGGGIIGTYQTDGNVLAKTFVYGIEELSPYYNPVQITRADSESKIHINSSSLGYWITIRKRPEGYLFSVRIGDEVLATSSGILISGCSYSKGQIVDVTPESALGDDSQCHEICEHSQIADEDVTLDLREVCAFDCINNEDTSSSKAFLDDVREACVYDNMLELFDPPTTVSSERSSSGSQYHTGLWCILIISLIYYQVN